MMLREGVTVVYKRTGTSGKVVELKEIDGKVWAKLDSTSLFYDEDFLEAVEDDKIQTMDKDSAEGKRARAETPEIREEGKIDTSGNVCGAG